MKKLVMLFAAITVVLFGCKKSDSTETTEVTCKLLKAVTTTNGTTVSTYYTFDNSGKLSLVKEQTGAADTSLVRKYNYTGNEFSFSNWSDNSGNSDTIYYAYDASKRIMQTLKHHHSGGITLNIVTNYTYNSTNQVIRTVAKSTTDYINYTTDSTIYNYAKSNVSDYAQFTKVGNAGWSTYRVKLGYDDKKNYYKTTGEPQISYLYWSANNLLGYYNPDSTNAYKAINFSDYTGTGYPQTFIYSFRPDQPNTHISGSLTYKCQ